MLLTLHYRIQTTESEHLRQKLKQYADYDEIKRELEIMKVRLSREATIASNT